MRTSRDESTDLASVGIEGLDHILRGGLPRNCIYLLEGNPGTGKTTIALQFLLEGVRQGETGLYVTLSETREELLKVATSHGWSLDGISIFDLAIPEDSLQEEASYTLYHPSEVELGETTRAVFDEVARTAPQRIVFDSLSEMRLLARDPLRYRRQVLALKQFFVGRQCTVLLLDDHTSPESDRQLESLAHGVLMLEHNSPDYGGPRRRLRVLKLRGVDHIGGYHDFNIIRGGVVLFPRRMAATHRRESQGESLSSGVKQLDDLMGGGLDASTAALFIGPAGTGKSSIATQYVMAAARQGQNSAMFLFDESVSTLLERSAGIGMDLERWVKEGRCTLRQIDPAELTPGEFFYLVRQEVERREAKLVVIDSVNGYFQSMTDNRFLSAHMHELLAYLGQQGVKTIIIVGQQGLFGTNMAPPVDLSYLADCILLLRYFEARGRVLKALAVVKKRTGNHENTIREFRIGANGIEVGKELTEFHGVLTGMPQYLGGADSLMGAGNGTDEE